VGGGGDGKGGGFLNLLNLVFSVFSCHFHDVRKSLFLVARIYLGVCFADEHSAVVLHVYRGHHIHRQASVRSCLPGDTNVTSHFRRKFSPQIY
jgi:hypothetical protein